MLSPSLALFWVSEEEPQRRLELGRREETLEVSERGFSLRSLSFSLSEEKRYDLCRHCAFYVRFMQWASELCWFLELDLVMVDVFLSLYDPHSMNNLSHLDFVQKVAFFLHFWWKYLVIDICGWCLPIAGGINWSAFDQIRLFSLEKKYIFFSFMHSLSLRKDLWFHSFCICFLVLVHIASYLDLNSVK